MPLDTPATNDTDQQVGHAALTRRVEALTRAVEGKKKPTRKKVVKKKVAKKKAASRATKKTKAG